MAGSAAASRARRLSATPDVAIGNQETSLNEEGWRASTDVTEEELVKHLRSHARCGSAKKRRNS